MTSESKQKFARPELLSPAGSMDCLTAAVTNGADAVYLGTSEFNARLNAKNFPLVELAKATKYCHDHGVRLYLTMNTLVKNNELKRFFSVLSDVYSLGVDGVIIQHISFLEIIKNNFPGLKVFMSTQAAIGNTLSASLVKAADRVILPREMPMAEVKKIIDSGVRAEVFVHGALCFGFSGLCLFSSFVDNRSGNRGSCAQLCRQNYNGCYPMSTRELCLARKVPELIQAGVTGFKIEGRMRSPLYVAVATRLYRKAIDSFLAGKFVLPEKEMREIEVVFNREFTEGFMFGDANLVSPEKPMNRGAFLGTIEAGEIKLSRAAAVGNGVGIWQKNTVSGAIVKEIFLAGKKVNRADAGETVKLGIEADEGSRIYLTSSTAISIKPDFSVEKPPLAQPARKKITAALPQITPGKSPSLKLLVKAYSITEARESLKAGADIVFYDIFAPDFPEKQDASVGAYLPRIMNDAELIRALDLLREKRSSAILTGNIGFLARRAEFDVPVYLDYALNVFNDIDLLFYRRYKVTPILSPELSLNEMAAFKNKDAAVFCHGDLVLVNTMIELKYKSLTNDKGFAFPVRKEDGYWQILNSRPYGVFNDIRNLFSLGFSQFFIDKQGQGPAMVQMYRNMLGYEVSDRRKRKGHTSGHLYRPVA
jgi:collagenase-like PrtC family protease